MTVTVTLGLALGLARGMQGTALTVDQAIQIADANAFTVKTAKSSLEKLRQRVNEAKGGLGPKLVVGATYTRFDKENKAQFGSQGSPPVIISPIESKQAVATVSLPIDIAGNIGRGIKAAEASIRAAQETIEAAQNDVRRDVRKAYVAVLRANAQLAVAKQTRDDEIERLKNVQAQKDQGTLAQVDVLKQQAELQQSESDLIAAQNAVQIAKESLNNAMARPIETPVEVAEIDVNQPLPDDSTRVVQLAESTRPEIRSIMDTRIALAEITKATASGLQPSLNLAFNYIRNIAAAGFSTRAQSANSTLTFSFPIFDSGVTRARIKEAREDEVQAKIQQDQLELSISLEVQQAITNLVNAKQRLAVATKQVDFATESYRLARVKLQEGGGILLEVKDAETALAQARTGLVNARYDYVNATTDLQRAVGTDTPVGNGPNAGEVGTGGAK